jgi:hypothetical protein
MRSKSIAHSFKQFVRIDTSIFAQKIVEKLAILTQITSIKVAKRIITSGLNKSAFFRRKWTKIAE